MVSAIEALQDRVDVIRATGDDDLAGRAWHALSKVLFEFTRERTGRTGRTVPIIQRVACEDAERLLSDMQELQRISLSEKFDRTFLVGKVIIIAPLSM